jgi:hypothetical protein
MTTPNQRWDATDYAANARFVADLGQPVLELLHHNLANAYWTSGAVTGH